MSPSQKTASPSPGLHEMQRHAADAAQLLRAMSNEQRLGVLCLLTEGEHSVGALQDRLDIGQSALSQHLAKLREAGLVSTRREAQSIYYSLSAGPVHQLMQTLHAIYCAPPRTRRARRPSR